MGCSNSKSGFQRSRKRSKDHLEIIKIDCSDSNSDVFKKKYKTLTFKKHYSSESFGGFQMSSQIESVSTNNGFNKQPSSMENFDQIQQEFMFQQFIKEGEKIDNNIDENVCNKNKLYPSIQKLTFDDICSEYFYLPKNDQQFMCEFKKYLQEKCINNHDLFPQYDEIKSHLNGNEVYLQELENKKYVIKENENFNQKLTENIQLYNFCQQLVEVLDKITDGELQNCLFAKQVQLYDLLPSINPVMMGVSYFYRKLIRQRNYHNQMDQAYSKNSLPKIAYVNLDGYTDPFQINMLKNLKNFQYYSIFDDDIHGKQEEQFDKQEFENWSSIYENGYTFFPQSSNIKQQMNQKQYAQNIQDWDLLNKDINSFNSNKEKKKERTIHNQNYKNYFLFPLNSYAFLHKYYSHKKKEDKFIEIANEFKKNKRNKQPIYYSQNSQYIVSYENNYLIILNGILGKKQYQHDSIEQLQIDKFNHYYFNLEQIQQLENSDSYEEYNDYQSQFNNIKQKQRLTGVKLPHFPNLLSYQTIFDFTLLQNDSQLVQKLFGTVQSNKKQNKNQQYEASCIYLFGGSIYDFQQEKNMYQTNPFLKYRPQSNQQVMRFNQKTMDFECIQIQNNFDVNQGAFDDLFKGVNEVYCLHPQDNQDLYNTKILEVQRLPQDKSYFGLQYCICLPIAKDSILIFGGQYPSYLVDNFSDFQQQQQNLSQPDNQVLFFEPSKGQFKQIQNKKQKQTFIGKYLEYLSQQLQKQMEYLVHFNLEQQLSDFQFKQPFPLLFSSKNINSCSKIDNNSGEVKIVNINQSYQKFNKTIIKSQAIKNIELYYDKNQVINFENPDKEWKIFQDNVQEALQKQQKIIQQNRSVSNQDDKQQQMCQQYELIDFDQNLSQIQFVIFSYNLKKKQNPKLDNMDYYIDKNQIKKINISQKDNLLMQNLENSKYTIFLNRKDSNLVDKQDISKPYKLVINEMIPEEEFKNDQQHFINIQKKQNNTNTFKKQYNLHNGNNNSINSNIQQINEDNNNIKHLDIEEVAVGSSLVFDQDDNICFYGGIFENKQHLTQRDLILWNIKANSLKQ
ncbi:hypothetical protein PPERSA_09821 [Pseudocohnilembus persalinus]|uniref:Kelch motif protein n=1 Tax=Pseudocohnilembus persalinus TaxID=266149 RepID=A0A0V0QU03_PSEPJ|nr:hypothetical protein PPERSA_09821 [Pseudocohnilembus persalinus]|eukprot:KRX05681.1 hypothetical protein PPERSA_09821 [Pseudocohnilembus persalinus]